MPRPSAPHGARERADRGTRPRATAGSTVLGVASLLGWLVVVGAPRPASGQRAFDAPGWPERWQTELPPQAAPVRAVVQPTLLSAAVPGLGQLSMDQRRGWAYLAVETLGWTAYVNRRSAGGDFRDRYRDLAWSTARMQGAVRVDGPFSYYERMSHWTRSGAFDVDAATTGVQPEADPTTYNGSVWNRAVGLYLPGGAAVPPTDPGYQSALAYYREHAYGADFLWDWTGTGAAQQAFADLIGDSDDRFRQATNVLGAILANHLVSAVDAYLSARGAAPPLEMRVEPIDAWGGTRWTGRVRFRWPR